MSLLTNKKIWSAQQRIQRFRKIEGLMSMQALNNDLKKNQTKSLADGSDKDFRTYKNRKRTLEKIPGWKKN